MSEAPAYLSALAAQLPQQHEESAFGTRQAAAWQFLLAQGLPTARDEAYRRTPFTKRLEAMQPELDTVAAPWPEDLQHPLEKRAICVRLLDGCFADAALPQLPAGLKIGPLDAAYQRHAEGLPPAFSSPLREEDAFVMLNEAAFGRGLFIHVAAGVQVTRPVLLLQHARAAATARGSYPRVVVYLDRGAQLTLIDAQSSQGTIHQNSVMEAFCAQDARLTLCKLQEDSPQALRIDHTYVQQQAGSCLESYVFSAGADMLRNNLYVRLQEEGARANLKGLYLCGRRSHIDNHSTLDHAAARTYSDQTYKGIVGDQGRGVFNGRIFMRPGAVEATAYQTNKNLLLGAQARVHTKPQLEIWVDDVRCSHGCTVGQLSLEQLFYLRARGISKAMSEEMLLLAFVEALFAELPPALSDYLRQQLQQRLQRDIQHRLI